MDTVKNDKKETSDVMLLLAEEAEQMIGLAGKTAVKEVEEETEKFLRQYEQKARQIILKIREDSRERANEIAGRFRDALILQIEEASTTALSQSIIDAGSRTGEIARRMQEATRREVRQALAEGLMAGGPVDRNKRGEEKPASRPEMPTVLEGQSAPAGDSAGMEAKPPADDFESWLRQ